MPPGTGIDGTDGNQPRGTQVTGNMCHEYGFNQKQSSCVFMAKSMQTNITGNIMFNAARAHVNQNDGFGGGTNLEANLIYSSCRESSDHGAPTFRPRFTPGCLPAWLALTDARPACMPGPFNSWDRQPYAYERKPDGSLNLSPANITIHRNLFFANYGAGQSVDNDDGSSYYEIHHNVEYASGGLKSDYAGHSKLYHHNLNVGGGNCGMYNYYQEGHQDKCYNNTFVLGGPRTDPTAVSSRPGWADLRGCDATAPRCTAAQNPFGGGPAPIMTVEHNTVYNFNQSAGDVMCSSTPLSLAQFKEKCGVDGGVSSARLPSTNEVVACVGSAAARAS
jgi:hypothetical protein